MRNRTVAQVREIAFGKLPLAAVSMAAPLLLIVAAFASHHAGLLRDLIPALLPLCALVLLQRDRSRYYGFLLCAWFFVPMLRRLVDYNAGWIDPNPMLIAPYFVALAAPLANTRTLLRAPLSTVAPYLAGLLAVVIAAIAGIFRYPMTGVVHGAVQWVTPILFAAYLSVTGEQHAFRTSLRRWLPPLLVIAAAYTLLQFAFAFPWDMAWLLNLDLPSMGGTSPFAIRAFGPFNSAGVAAFAFSCGSIYLLHTRWRWRLPAFALTTLALLTTEVRAGWLALAVGVLLSLWRAPRRTAIAAGMLLVLAAALSLWGLSNDAVNISDRLQSFTQATDDTSAQSRMAGYDTAWYYLERNPLGAGLGVPENFFDIQGDFSLMDSGPVDIFITFGVLGGCAYCFGLLLLLLPAIRSLASSRDEAALSMTTPALALLSVILLGSVTVDLPGLLIWSLLACSEPVRDRVFSSFHRATSPLVEFVP